MTAIAKSPIVIYAESTPNPSAMKFVANQLLLENSSTVEFFNPTDAKSFPLVIELFKFPFVKSVFIASHYITIFKIDAIDWDGVILELREFVRSYLSQGKPVMIGNGEVGTSKNNKEEQETGKEAVEHAAPQSEIEKKIIDVLEQYVSPAVEQDGGMIVFRSYKDGIVSLFMRGACSGCPSSTSTLKGGIEALLKKFIPEVKEVVGA